MKRIAAKVVTAGAILAVSVGAAFLLTREPSIDGHSLSNWLRLGIDNQFRRDNTDVTNAVRRIGVKAVPVLLHKAQAVDAAWKGKLISTRARTLLPAKWVHSTGYQHAEAQWGFSILGTQAVSAIPRLSAMLLDGRGVGYMLGSVGPDSLPVLKAALSNQNRAIRMEAILGITARPDVAHLSLGEIIAQHRETNDLSAIVAVTRAASVLPEDDQSIVIKEFLADPRRRVQSAALRAISYKRINPVSAIPLVVPFLTNSDFSLREQASNTLLRIAPSQAADYGIGTNQPARRSAE